MNRLESVWRRSALLWSGFDFGLTDMELHLTDVYIYTEKTWKMCGFIYLYAKHKKKLLNHVYADPDHEKQGSKLPFNSNTLDARQASEVISIFSVPHSSIDDLWHLCMWFGSQHNTHHRTHSSHMDMISCLPSLPSPTYTSYFHS